MKTKTLIKFRMGKLTNKSRHAEWRRRKRQQYDNGDIEALPISVTKEYSRQKSREYYSKNIEKLRAYNKKRRDSYKQNNIIQPRDRAKYYKYVYGITIEELNEKILKQDKLCDLCKRPLEIIDFQTRNRSTALDHNHTTGELRGVLHQKCNAMLGLAEENTDILELAIDYLYRWNGYK